jgi:hypothetical protein
MNIFLNKYKMKLNIKDILNEITKDYSIFVLLLSTISMFLFPQYSLLFGILLFSSFDYLVFQRIVKTDRQLTGLIPYRVVQTILQYTIGYVIYQSCGLNDFIWYMLIWFFGVCDMLYYIIGKESFLQYTNMYWLWWTPIGIINKQRKIENNGYDLLFESLIIIIAYIIYNLWV